MNTPPAGIDPTRWLSGCLDARAGLLFEQDFPASDDARAVFRQRDGLAPRALERQQRGATRAMGGAKIRDGAD